MATYALNTHSLRGSKRTPPLIDATQPITPVHSPHHSVTSSLSYRTPNHTLTIHEYRKQQQTPVLHSATPPGKTLRRKAALSSLGDIERPASVTRAASTTSSPSLRQLHYSQSVQLLNTTQPPLQPLTLSALAFRSQSAEPRVQGGSVSSVSTTNLQGKVGYFKSRKRLPKPPAATGHSLNSPFFANVTSANHHYSPLPANLGFSTESIQSSEAPNTTGSSTFSLSQFPKPPHEIDLSLSPPHDEEDLIHLNPLSFATTAPETPPATPAIIHYRGVSFDLVNPHNSLVLHDIVTPSREYDSNEYLPLPSPEDPLLASSEMAPKRALYGNLGAARAGIMKRHEDPDLPSPPTPAAISPNSSSYTSPMYSPEPAHMPSPLAIKKPVKPDRFSLRRLTRTLTKTLGSNTFEEHELEDIRNSSVSLGSNDTEDQYAQAAPLSYVTAPQPSYFPTNAMSPITPTSPTFPENSGALTAEEPQVQSKPEHWIDDQNVEPLTSMVPDDSSMQMGRMGISISSPAEHDLPSNPYYDDIDSWCASSSIYTRDDRRVSNHRQSLASQHQSNPFARYSNNGGDGYANDGEGYYENNPFYGDDEATFTAATQHPYDHTNDQEELGRDTISKFIENYRPHNDSASSSAPVPDSFDSYNTNEAPMVANDTSEMSQFDFGLEEEQQHDSDEVANPFEDVHEHATTMRTRSIGLPPHEMAPPAPAFEYDDIPFLNRRYDFSEVFSNMSSCSYGETRNLLQISQYNPPAPHIPELGLQPSSSYSQPEGPAFGLSSSDPQLVDSSPRPPQEALDQAEQIFEDAAANAQQQDDEIPAIWGRRSSISLLHDKKRTSNLERNKTDPESYPAADAAGEEDKADWETLAGQSQDGRDSIESMADYSSEGSSDDLGFQPQRSYPSPSNQILSPNPPNFIFPTPVPVRSLYQNSASSPPALRMERDISTSSEELWPASSPPISKTAPLFHRPENAIGKGAVEEPYDWSPRTNPYAFGQKETMELLASGPNDDVIIEQELNRSTRPRSASRAQQDEPEFQEAIPLQILNPKPQELERENTFEKISVVGPKGNLTGTPNGTGMQETGSSIANISSPIQRLNSSVDRSSFRSDYDGFYASPFPATGSITRIRGPPAVPQQQPARSRPRSHPTIFLRGKDGVEEIEVTEELPCPTPRLPPKLPPKNPSRSKRSQRSSRAAVPGQTKLRQMLLASDVQSTAKSTTSQDTTFSRFIDITGRPSSDTTTPLRPTHNQSIGTLPLPGRSALVHQHSPHLLDVERAPNPEEEARRTKLSWAILFFYFFIPPFIILHRFLGDRSITLVTQGRLRYCTARSKRFALIAGITINIGAFTAVMIPVFVAYAVKDG